MTTPQEHPRRALGRGLGALLPTREPIAAGPAPGIGPDEANRAAIDQIDPNPMQPRRVFQADALRELADSIRQHGIIQPLVVRRSGTRFQLVAGERRWRAARIAGMSEVPVVVQEIPDDRLLEITLIENVQREDLNPIEFGMALEQMARELNISHEEIGRRTGKDRSTIANAIRLLQLPADLQQLVGERRLSAGHARCLLGLTDEETQRKLAEKIVAQGLSVRQVERMTKRLTEPRDPASDVDEALDPNVKAAIGEMERVLGTKVRIVEKSGKRGRIEIEYYSSEDLDRIYGVIVGPTE
ncbi:MAG TPA: ParB/RepB/Spo0J family partition protein [Bryobacteraceae bacterium]|nr:ParB/RepB/Spo0J family partition protein [Bryobacteraceae bacterium]